MPSFEEHFQKAPFSYMISVDGRGNLSLSGGGAGDDVARKSVGRRFLTSTNKRREGYDSKIRGENLNYFFITTIFVISRLRIHLTLKLMTDDGIRLLSNYHPNQSLQHSVKQLSL